MTEQHSLSLFNFTIKLNISNHKAVNSTCIYLRDIKTNIYQRICTSILKAILLIRAMKWNSKTKKEWINMIYSYNRMRVTSTCNDINESQKYDV